MDSESDGDEFYDATEFPSSSTPVKEGSIATSRCQNDKSPTGIPKDHSMVSSLSENENKVDNSGHDLEDGDSYHKVTEKSDVDQEIATDDTNRKGAVIDIDRNTEKVDSYEDEVICENRCEPSDAEQNDKYLHHEADQSKKGSLSTAGSEPDDGEVNQQEVQVKDEMTAQNTSPVAPPRRKKKNKKRPEPVQNLNIAGDEDFTLVTNPGKELDKKDENNGLINAPPKVTFHNYQDECVSAGESVISDLDISTQEMSEILDRNNYIEVISPQHVSVHLQRNKSQSISSIGSFCSVSSNLSLQDKMKRSGSQVSVGSVNAIEKVAPTVNHLTDQEILEQVVVKNLDTGECIPLSLAEKHVPTGVNPLALHIMRLTSEFSSKRDLAGSDREDAGDNTVNETTRKISRKKKNLRGLFGRKVQKLKTTKEGGKRADETSSSDEDNSQHPDSYIKIKSANGKGIPIINKLNLIQDLSGQHQGAVWTMKFSCCGKLLATAGQDKVVHVWVLKNEKNYFEQMRAKYAKADRPTSHTNTEKPENKESVEKDKDAGSLTTETDYPEGFCKEPFCTYRGHVGDVLDLSWSKNYFLLSSSMDKTVRLWHISRSECLCCFQHIDFVTAITFHPRDDRYFLSGSLDGKIRLWNIPDKKVALWNELEGAGSNLITAANFCMNGKFAVVGTYDGRCIFYETEHLKYFTQWQVRSTRKKQGRKISGIEPMPGEDKILITSSDSRIRLYSLKDHSLHCKYKGFTNSSSQIKGSFSHDGEFVISGSEDHYVYMWRTQHRVPSSRKDRNDFYESFSAHNAVVTAAIFAPCPWNVVPTEYDENSTGKTGQEVIVAADWNGAIKIFINRYQNEKSNL